MTLVVPFPPGGSNDTFARVLAVALSTKLDYSVVVEKRPGAGGAIGAEYVSRAPTDGSVLMLSSSTFTTNAAVQPALKYDAVTSFASLSSMEKAGRVRILAIASPQRSPFYPDIREIVSQPKGRELFRQESAAPSDMIAEQFAALVQLRR